MQSPARFTTATIDGRHYVRETVSGALTGPFVEATAQQIAAKWNLISAALRAAQADPQG